MKKKKKGLSVPEVLLMKAEEDKEYSKRIHEIFNALVPGLEMHCKNTIPRSTK